MTALDEPTATQIGALPGYISLVDFKPLSLPQFKSDAPASFLQQGTTVTIDYTYYPLYRLTSAEYSTGDSYQYTYDAVGNRLTETTPYITNEYTYFANRLTYVRGSRYADYLWDANGNLVNDGNTVYTYNTANRLTSVTVVNGEPMTAEYTYNGLGDRLSQTINGVTTNYTLDLNAGLTQVLADGTNTYTYGLGRIAQTNTDTEYFLGDALGSVRQLTDSTGTVTLAKSYAPYGTVTAASGSGQSAYGFTGEMADVTGLTYLRARYYSPVDGRFMSRDTWDGNYNRPLSLNRWMYVEGNPVNLVDPTGMMVCDCLVRWPNEFPTFISSGVFGYDYDVWKQWPWYPPSLPGGVTPITAELWSRHIVSKELGEVWKTNTCVFVDDNGVRLLTEKVSLIESGVIQVTGGWQQLMFVVQIYQFGAGRFKPFNGGWVIKNDQYTSAELPNYYHSNGVWPYPDLPPLPPGLEIYIETWFGSL